MNCCVSSRGFSGRRIRTDSRSIANELHAAQSGKYSPIPKCVPSGVDYYSVFKPICPSAYWYRETPVLPSFPVPPFQTLLVAGPQLAILATATLSSTGPVQSRTARSM